MINNSVYKYNRKPECASKTWNCQIINTTTKNNILFPLHVLLYKKATKSKLKNLEIHLCTVFTNIYDQ